MSVDYDPFDFLDELDSVSATTVDRSYTIRRNRDRVLQSSCKRQLFQFVK